MSPPADSTQHLDQAHREHQPGRRPQAAQRRDRPRPRVQPRPHPVGDADPADQQRRQANKCQKQRRLVDEAADPRRGLGWIADAPSLGWGILRRSPAGCRLDRGSSGGWHSEPWRPARSGLSTAAASAEVSTRGPRMRGGANLVGFGGQRAGNPERGGAEARGVALAWSPSRSSTISSSAEARPYRPSCDGPARRPAAAQVDRWPDPDQRPFPVHRFQFDQLPLPGRGDPQHGPHLRYGGCRGALTTQPVAQLRSGGGWEPLSISRSPPRSARPSAARPASTAARSVPTAAAMSPSAEGQAEGRTIHRPRTPPRSSRRAMVRARITRPPGRPLVRPIDAPAGRNGPPGPGRG